MGAPRIRDLELVQMVADLVIALDGKVGITNSVAASSEERQAR
jgi:hypothetical protein